jgi:hypothetical protein
MAYYSRGDNADTIHYSFYQRHRAKAAAFHSSRCRNEAFSSIRMAPLYDAVTTRVFPRLKHDHMALKLNG